MSLTLAARESLLLTFRSRLKAQTLCLLVPEKERLPEDAADVMVAVTVVGRVAEEEDREEAETALVMAEEMLLALIRVALVSRYLKLNSQLCCR